MDPQPQASNTRQTRMQSQAGGMQQPRSLLFQTTNHLPENVRVPIIQRLNRALADTIVLRRQLKFAHWNIKGMEFTGLHELFDDIAERFEDQADEIGERITALGGQAIGTVAETAANTRVPKLPTEAVTGAEYVDLLIDRLAAYDASLSQDINFANQYGDVDTADLLNEISRTVSKDLWFLETHFQTEPTASISLTEQTGSGMGAVQQGQQQVGQQYSQPQQTGGVSQSSQAGQQRPVPTQEQVGGSGQQRSTPVPTGAQQ